MKVGMRSGPAARVITLVTALALMAAVVATYAPAQAETASNAQPTGAPTISGTARVGQTLTVDTSAIADTNGLTDVSYSGTWYANEADDTSTGGYIRKTISAGESLSYTVSRRDVDLTLKIQVNFTDDAGNYHTLFSAKTATVSATTPAAPWRFYQTLASSDGVELQWEAPRYNVNTELLGLVNEPWGDGGSPITGYVVQWKEVSGSWDTDSDVSEATVTGTTYTVQNLAGGTSYKVRVRAVNSIGRGTPSREETIVGNHAPTGAPTISGTEQVGQTLTASTAGISDADGLTDPNYGYQWLADDTEIDGATSSTYKVQASDNGKVIKVRVYFTDDADNEEVLTSAGTSEVVVGGL